MATEASAIPSRALIQSSALTAAGSGGVTGTAAATTSTGANQTLGATDFLSLLTTQLANQNPLNPVDDTQSVSELAQFSALQSTNTLSTNFANFESNFAVSQASGLLGETVTVWTADASGNASTLTGAVKTIQVVNGLPQFTMVDAKGNAIAASNGTPLQFQTSQILGIAK